MTSDQTYDDDDDALAAEVAMGVLTGEEQASAQRRVADDPGFAQLVTAWEIRLAALSDELPDEVPNKAVKQALMTTLFPATAPRPLWERLWIWQAGAALSLALLAAVLTFDTGPAEQSSGPLYTAEIRADAGDFRVVAVVDKSTNEVFLTRTRGAAPTGRILQVWGHGAGEPTISVGLWPEGDTIRLPLPADIAAVQGVLTLGVSEEPPGGSRTGLPSGRVFGTVDIPGVSSEL